MKVMQHPFPSFPSHYEGSCPKPSVPLYTALYTAAAGLGISFPEFPSSHNSFCSRGFPLWEFSVIVTENEAYKDCDLKN